MLGGGSLRTAPGQCTDDGEMTLSLARGLSKILLSVLIIRSMRSRIRSRESGSVLCRLGLISSIWHGTHTDHVKESTMQGITTGATIGCVLKGQHNPAFHKHLAQIGHAKAMQNAAVFDNASSTSILNLKPFSTWKFTWIQHLLPTEVWWDALLWESLVHRNSTWRTDFDRIQVERWRNPSFGQTRWIFVSSKLFARSRRCCIFYRHRWPS